MVFSTKCEGKHRVQIGIDVDNSQERRKYPALNIFFPADKNCSL